MALSSQLSQLISDSKGCFNYWETKVCSLLLVWKVTSQMAQFPSESHSNRADFSPVACSEVSEEVFTALFISYSYTQKLWIASAFCDKKSFAHCPKQMRSCTLLMWGWLWGEQGSKMRSLADARNTFLFFHQIFSLENYQNNKRKQGGMWRTRGRKLAWN